MRHLAAFLIFDVPRPSLEIRENVDLKSIPLKSQYIFWKQRLRCIINYSYIVFILHWLFYRLLFIKYFLRILMTRWLKTPIFSIIVFWCRLFETTTTNNIQIGAEVVQGTLCLSRQKGRGIMMVDADDWNQKTMWWRRREFLPHYNFLFGRDFMCLWKKCRKTNKQPQTEGKLWLLLYAYF